MNLSQLHRYVMQPNATIWCLCNPQVYGRYLRALLAVAGRDGARAAAATEELAEQFEAAAGSRRGTG